MNISFTKAEEALTVETIFAVAADSLPVIAEAIKQTMDVNAREGLQARDGSIASHTAGGVAVLRLSGFLSQRPTFLSLLLGGTSIEEFSQRLRAAVADPGVSTIVLDVDSPGGGAHSIQELATEIYNARNQKHIIASVNSMAASAAYWLVSNAHEIHVTPSGELGSIGVFAIHHDVSGANEKAGVKPTYVSSGKFKIEANRDSPLSAEAHAHLQKRVDEYFESFVSSVARGRNVSSAQVRNGFAEGRLVGAAEAVRLGMADRVATLSEVIASAMGPPTSKALNLRKRSSSELLSSSGRRQFKRAFINGGPKEAVR